MLRLMVVLNAVALVAAQMLFTYPAHAQQVLKVGVLGILSGPGISWGEGLSRATEMAAEDFNSRGGLNVQGQRYQVEIVKYDGKFKPADSAAAMNRIVFEDKIKLVMGPQGAATVYATQGLATENKVITMMFGWSPRIISPQTPYQFGITISDREFARPQIEWIAKRLKAKKIGGLLPNDEGGQQGAKTLKEIYESVGTPFVSELFDRDRVDFAPLLTRLVGQGVDVIELDGNTPGTAGSIIKQVREMGFTGPIVRTGGPATKEILAIAGPENAEGIYFHSAVNPASPKFIAFKQRYAAKYGDKADMNGFTPAFYDGASVLLSAVEKAGTVSDTDKIRDAIENIKFDGVQGPLIWTGRETYGIAHQIVGNFYIMQLKGGKEEAVAECTITGCK